MLHLKNGLLSLSISDVYETNIALVKRRGRYVVSLNGSVWLDAAGFGGDISVASGRKNQESEIEFMVSADYYESLVDMVNIGAGSLSYRDLMFDGVFTSVDFSGRLVKFKFAPTIAIEDDQGNTMSGAVAINYLIWGSD